MQEILLIGGHYDGKRIKVPELLPDFRAPYFSHYTEEEDRIYETDLYQLQSLACGENVYHFYALKGLTGDDAIKMLLANYQECMHAAEIS